MRIEEESKFKKLFGIDPGKLSEVIIISPFFNVKLFSARLKQKRFFKGLIFHGVTGVYENKEITYINTGIGKTLVADCILAQDPQKIKAMIFLGAVGAVQNLEIADNIIIDKAFFDTEFYLNFGLDFKEDKLKCFYPDDQLIEKSLHLAKKQKYDFKKANVSSIHTLWDQNKKKTDRLLSEGVQSVDLECALFYAAAKIKKIKAIAFCYVSDQIISHPFWGEFSPIEKQNIKSKIVELVYFSLLLSEELSK